MSKTYILIFIFFISLIGCNVYDSDEILAESKEFYKENTKVLEEMVSYTMSIEMKEDKFSVYYVGNWTPSLQVLYDSGDELVNDAEFYRANTNQTFFSKNQITMIYIKDSLIKFEMPFIRNEKYVFCELVYFIDDDFLTKNNLPIKKVDGSEIMKINSKWAVVSPSSF